MSVCEPRLGDRRRYNEYVDALSHIYTQFLVGLAQIVKLFLKIADLSMRCQHAWGSLPGSSNPERSKHTSQFDRSTLDFLSGECMEWFLRQKLLTDYSDEERLYWEVRKVNRPVLTEDPVFGRPFAHCFQNLELVLFAWITHFSIGLRVGNEIATRLERIGLFGDFFGEGQED